MKVPPNQNLVRLTGLGLAKPPRGFVRAPDLQHIGAHFAVRRGYEIKPCPGEAHRDPDSRGCGICDQFYGAVAIKSVAK